MSLLGVFNINNLTECTKVLPQPSAPYFNPPDQPVLNTWMNITRQIEPFAKAVMNGDILSGLMGMLTGQNDTQSSGEQGVQDTSQNAVQVTASSGEKKPCKRRLLRLS